MTFLFLSRNLYLMYQKIFLVLFPESNHVLSTSIVKSCPSYHNIPIRLFNSILKYLFASPFNLFSRGSQRGFSIYKLPFLCSKSLTKFPYHSESLQQLIRLYMDWPFIIWSLSPTSLTLTCSITLPYQSSGIY